MRSTHAASAVRARLNLEALETRSLMSAEVAATFVNGILRVNGTAGDDEIIVREMDGTVTVDGVEIKVKGGQFVDEIEADMVKRVVINAYGGDDIIRLNLEGEEVMHRASVNGGTGNDVIFGGTEDDTLRGGAGNDRIFGWDGTDFIFGDAGNDFIDDGDRDADEKCTGGAGLDWNADILAIKGVNGNDVRQWGSPSCSFLSTISGLTINGYDLTEWITYEGATEDGEPVYTVSFSDGSDWMSQEIVFDGQLTDLDTRPAAEGESWVIILNRAWMEYHGDDGACYPHEAILALTGQEAGVGEFYDEMMSDECLNIIVDTLQNGGLVIAGTGPEDFITTPVLVNNHAYTVLDVFQQGGQVYIMMRNPWGVDGGKACGNAKDGIVWVTWNDFVQCMGYLAIQ